MESAYKSLVVFTTALTQFDIKESVIQELEEATNLEITDTKSDGVVRKFRQTAKGLQVNIEKHRLKLNREFKKKTDGAAVLLAPRITAVYEKLDAKIKAVEAVKEEKKTAAAKIEKERLAGIDFQILYLTGTCSAVTEFNIGSCLISERIMLLEEFEISKDVFQEKIEIAEGMKTKALEAGESYLSQKCEWEKQQAENARLAEENAAQAKELADQQAAFEKEQKEAQDETDRVETIQTELTLLKRLCLLVPGVSTAVMKAHKENLSNMKPDKRIFQEKYPEACSIVETAFENAFIAWENAVKQDNVKEQIRTDREALGKDRADMASEKQAEEDRINKVSEVFFQAMNQFNRVMKEGPENLNGYFVEIEPMYPDKDLFKERLPEWITLIEKQMQYIKIMLHGFAITDHAQFLSDYWAEVEDLKADATARWEATEKAKAEKVEREKLTGPDKIILSKKISLIGEFAAEFNPLTAGYRTDEAAQIELDLLVRIGRAIEDAENACEDLV